MKPIRNTPAKLSDLTVETVGSERLYAGRPPSIITLLRNMAEERGSCECLVDNGVRLTYGQLYSSAASLASAIHRDYGIGKGDRVALMLSTGYEYVISLFALAGLGAISVPLNTALKGQELLFPINDSGATLLIVDSEGLDSIASIRTDLRKIQAIILTGTDSSRDTASFAGLVGNGGEFPAHPTIGENDSAVLLYTSGTTGAPKGALLSNKNVIASAMNNAHLSGLHAGHDSMLIVAPLFHITGIAMSLCASIYAGIRIVLTKRFKAPDALKLIEKEKISVVIAVPTVFWLLFHAAEFESTNLSSLRFLASGGAPVADDLLRVSAEKLPGVEFAPGYGLTEASGMTHSTKGLDEALATPGSVGRAMPLIDAKIVDATGRELMPGIPGELAVRGCQVMRQYWNNPQATHDTIVEGWLHTGDIAALTPEGNLRILDRMKDMIIRGGENIYSTEVENVLYMNPKVLEAAVVGIADPVFGEQVKAALVLRPGEEATSGEIQEFCKARMADYKVPYQIEFMALLPRNPAGKVMKKLLK